MGCRLALSFVVLVVATFSVTLAQAQSPLGDSLVARFDAGDGVGVDDQDVTPDGELVTEWSDISLDDNFFDSDLNVGMTGQPRLTEFTFDNGDLPAVYFDGASGVPLANDALLQPATDGQLSIYALVVPLTGQAQCIFANYRDVCGFGLGVSDNLSEEVKWFTALPIDSLESGVKDLFNGETTLLHVTYDNGNKVSRKNGAILGETSGVAMDFGCGETQLTLGFLDFGRQFFTGWIAEVLVYETVHDETERGQMEQYFTNKYGFQGGFVGPSDLICGLGAPGTFVMDWINNDPADSLEIYRDGALLATLNSGDDTFTDNAVPPGDHLYELRAHRGAIFASRTCDLIDTSSAQLTALTFFGTQGDGTVRLGERWNTIYPGPAWDVVVYPEGVITDQGDVDQDEYLNRPGDLQIRIPMTPGTHTFGFAVARNDEFTNFFGMNLYFDRGESVDAPAISVFANASDSVPSSGLFLPNSATTMGWPITDVPGSGVTSYTNCDLNYGVELTEFEVYTQPALGVDLLSKQEPGTINAKTGPLDGIADVQGQFTLVVTDLTGDCTAVIQPPINLNCAVGPSGDTVILNWENQEPYDQIRIFEDEVEIALLAGDAVTHTAGIPNAGGDHTYRVQAELGEQTGGPGCTITVFDSLTISAFTLNAAVDEFGEVNAGERWNTLHPDAAWDIGIREDGILDAVADYDPVLIDGFWLNDPEDGSINIPLAIGETRTFTLAVARNGLDPMSHSFYNVNIFFVGQENELGGGTPGISVLAEQSTSEPGSGGPFAAFNPNPTGTMGWPVAGTPGAGSLLYQNAQLGIQVEMTDFKIFDQLAPDGGLGYDFGSGGSTPPYVATLADGEADLLAEFTLSVTELIGDPTGACSQLDGSCDVTTQVDCENAGGTYQGNGAPCPETTGACCTAGN